jgi:hypothetical protein
MALLKESPIQRVDEIMQALPTLPVEFIDQKLIKARPTLLRRPQEKDDDLTDDLEELYRETPKTMDPVVLRSYGDQYELIDGERRTAKAAAAGRTTIRAVVVSCSADTAMVLALHLNAKAVRPLSRLEVMAAALAAVSRIPELASMSSRPLARLLGVSPSTAQRALRSVKADAARMQHAAASNARKKGVKPADGPVAPYVVTTAPMAEPEPSQKALGLNATAVPETAGMPTKPSASNAASANAGASLSAKLKSRLERYVRETDAIAKTLRVKRTAVLAFALRLTAKNN